MIVKRKHVYQVKVRDTSGNWYCQSFPDIQQARAYEREIVQKKYFGNNITNQSKHVVFDGYFNEWFKSTHFQKTLGWRKTQESLYRLHIQPVLGSKTLEKVSSQDVLKILNGMEESGLSKQSLLHAYNLLRRCFQDAIEVFHLLHQNPVLKRFRPRVPKVEAKYLNLDQIKALLERVSDDPYGLGIWLAIYVGLRVGEIQALSWDDVDLKEGVIHVRKTYVKSELIFREYPKGRKQHSHKIPAELLAKLTEWKAKRDEEDPERDLVVVPPGWKMLDYWKFLRVLKGFCRELKIPAISTHGLRHSSSEIWIQHGATREDLRILFAHVEGSTTDRYIHYRGTRLNEVAKVIALFPQKKAATA